MRGLGIRLNDKLRILSTREARTPRRLTPIAPEKRSVIGRLWPWILSFGVAVIVGAHLWRQS